MRQDYIPDNKLDDEIARLSADPDVLLARAEQRIRYRKRQYLYTLRSLAKRGAELRKQGITHETLGAIEDAIDKEVGKEA